MTLREEQRELRLNGMEPDDVGLVLCVGCSTPKALVVQADIAEAMRGDGTQAIPAAHERIRSRRREIALDLDSLPAGSGLSQMIPEPFEID